MVETAPEITAKLNDRYGRGRRHPLLWSIGGVIALAVLVWFGWSIVTSAARSVDAQDLGFTVVDEHTVTIDFRVTPPRGSRFACALQALDVEFGVVGWQIFEYDALDGLTRNMKETIPTVAEATTGLVSSCWVP